MLLGESERVIYKKTSLIQVVCQIRFPRILSINEKAPTDFQEQIREQYPLYNVAVEQQQQVFVPMDVKVSFPSTWNEWSKIHTFSSQDKAWAITLTSTYLALTTSAYKRWEDFLEHLTRSLEALKQIYKPAFFERVGLRYVNAVRRSQLLMDESTPWKDLIEPFALGFLLNDSFASEEVISYVSTTEVKVGKDALARINTSTGYMETEMRQPKPELSFIIDSDLFFGVRKRLDEIYEALPYLNQWARKLIQSIITEKLHNAMEPEKI